MSKNFRTSLRVWLNKVYSLCKKPKKTATTIAKKLTNFEIKESKEMIEERIVGNLFERFEDMRDRELGSAEGMALIQEFLRENELPINDKLQEMITQHVEKFFSKDSENNSDCQDYVFNIWSEETGTYECVCPKLSKGLQCYQQKEACYRCGRSCHINCLWGREKREELYECPMCFLRNCIPNRKVNRILFAGFLRQIKKDKIEYKINLPLENEAPEDSIIEVRCVRLCKDNKYEITWPMHCSVLINSKKLMEFKPLNTNSSIKKRVDDEIVLDKRFLSKRNTLTIEEKHQYVEGTRPTVYENHLVVICQVQPLTIEEITVEKMKERMPIEESKQILREYLDRGMHDCVIEQFKIKLKCQFYNGRITVPARSKHCTSHYQPFDLRGFIMANMNLRSSAQRWRCPICRERAYHLVVDQYLLDFISASKDVTDIEFNNNGECNMIGREESQNLSEKGAEEQEQFNCEVIECGNEEANQIDNLVEKSNNFVEFIEIQSEEDECIEPPKRPLNDSGEVEEIITGGPQKRQKQSSPQNRINPLSFLRQKRAINLKDSSEVSDSDEINFESKYTPDISPDFKPERKERKERKPRKDRVFEEQPRKDIDRMSKIPVSTPAISTVIPQAIRILDKKIPGEVLKKTAVQVAVIDIESDSENDHDEQVRRQTKINYHLKELENEKMFLTHRGEKCEITPSDETIFLSLCEKFMTASIKGY